MKKTLIALAVAGAAVATGVNAGELYNQDGTSLALGGRAEARMSILDGDVADQSRVRINVSGKQEITDDLYGVGFYEAEYTTEDTNNTAATTADSIDHRYMYAGMGGSFGEVTYGKNDGALGVITDFTDIMDYHGAAASKKFVSSDRMDNMLSYKGDFGDFAVKAAYRYADRVDTGDVSNNGANGISLSGIYTVADTGVALGLGYASQDDDSGLLKAKGDQWIMAASYTWNDLYLSALYTMKDYDSTDNDYEGFELAASYKYDQALFIMTYGNGEQDSGNAEKADSLAIEAAYFFKPNFRGYIDYNFNMLDESEAGSKAAAEDEAVLGLRYDF